MPNTENESERSRINIWVDMQTRRAWDDFRRKDDISLTNLIKNAVNDYIRSRSSRSEGVSERLKEIAASRSLIQAERDDQLVKLQQDQQELKALMEKIASKMVVENRVNDEGKGKILDLLSGGHYDIKKISRLLSMPLPEVVAYLDDLDKKKLVMQDQDFKWGAIHV